MILTIDVGNTNTVIGGFDDCDKLAFESRIDTDRYRMADQYAIIINDILHLYKHSPEDFTGAIISSVVPPVTGQLKEAITKLCRCKVLTVGPGLKTGLNIKIDEPASLGADMAAVAVAAKEHYPLPAIVIDLGTATKVLAIDKTGAFVGGIIAPGVKISIEALANRTASLPLISINNDPPLKNVIGTNTIDCMRSGLLYGTAFMVDGMIESFEKELGEKCTVIATGGFSSVIQPLCKHDFTVDRSLIMTGLLDIYKKNMK